MISDQEFIKEFYTILSSQPWGDDLTRTVELAKASGGYGREPTAILIQVRGSPPKGTLIVSRSGSGWDVFAGRCATVRRCNGKRAEALTKLALTFAASRGEPALRKAG